MKKKIGMLVAVEMESVFTRYGTPERTEDRCGFKVYIYENEAYELFVIHSGIGELAAASATELLLDRYEAELIVNFGVVGGLTPEMAETKLCVVEKLVHYDFDLSGIDPLLPAQYPGYPDVYLPADEEMIRKALIVCPELKRVICASADKFVGNQADKERLHQEYAADICEMEAAAVLLTCRRADVPCLMIKAVADGLTGGGQEYFDALEESAARCFEVTDRIIREL